MQITYINIIESFHDWCYENRLDIKSQIIFIKILHLVNRGGWKEWTEIPNLRLMDLTMFTSEATFCKHRDKLIELKLLEYRKGKKAQPNKYKIAYGNFIKIKKRYTIEYTTKNESINENDDKYTVKNESISNSVSDSKSDSTTRSPNKTKTKDTEEEKDFNNYISLTTFEIYNNCDENMLCEHVCESTKSVCRRKSTYRINGKNYCNQHSKEILKNIESCVVNEPKKLKQAHGEFQNVLLAQDEYEKLKIEYGDEADKLVDFLSEYIEMKGYKAQSHYLAIRKWVVDAFAEQKLKKQELESRQNRLDSWTNSAVDERYRIETSTNIEDWV